MKKRFFMHGFRLLSVGALLTFGSAQALVTWSGVATSVTDDDIMITADSTVGGSNGTVVHAMSQNITVSMSSSIVLTGTQEPGLCLMADANRTITFYVDYDLQFTGSTVPLLITVQGPGNVIFKLADDKYVTFAAASAGAYGAKLLVLMGELYGVTDAAGRLTFMRQNTDSSSDVTILVGLKSIMTYIAPEYTDHEQGFITFDSANTDTDEASPHAVGRMRLMISNETSPGHASAVGTAAGAVYIIGNKVNVYTGCGPLNSNVDMTTMAGYRAQFKTQNGIGSTAVAGLLILNENTVMPELKINPWRSTTAFTGDMHGFIEGANGLIVIGQQSYFDYVGLANNYCPNPEINPQYLLGRRISSIVKQRNASAFIVDGTFTQYGVGSTVSRAQVQFENLLSGSPAGAMVFRSGIDSEGNINWVYGDFIRNDFSINPDNETSGAGEIVIDIEGRLDVLNPTDVLNEKLEILSWVVAPYGGPVIINGSETNYPLRTFETNYRSSETTLMAQYNKACALINNRLNLDTTCLVHTDKNHVVNENDDVNSEPTYIGGERNLIENSSNDIYRGKIAFYDSWFMVHTSVALTGVDLFVPNGSLSAGMSSGFKNYKTIGDANLSIFTFYNNGTAYDDGTGCQMILGTQIGSTACDACCASMNRDAHVNIYQETNPSITGGVHTLLLDVAPNNGTILNDLPSPLVGQEIQTIYLGHASNISIGDADLDNVWTVTTYPSLFVNGDFFSFETRGGDASNPDGSAVTGQGGIFVDNHGLFQVNPSFRASMGAMVVKSGDGTVVLPEATVHFKNGVGVSAWDLDLTEVSQQTIIGPTEELSDYTLNWRDVTKDYANYLPYENTDYEPCSCTSVTATNTTSLPVVKGLVEQFQIRGSRLGNSAQLRVDDGWIRELVFLPTCDSAEAATAAIYLSHHGRVGLGTRHKNLDSIYTQFTLGINGVTIIADGSGRVDLNEDIIIDNTCHILAGPNMVGTDKLQFYSDTERSLIVKNGGVLDLRSFSYDLTTTATRTVEFAGNVKLVLEPGAVVALANGGILRFTDNARIETSPKHDLAEITWGTTTASTNEFRVKIVGQGTIQLDQDSQFVVGDDAYVGIENNACFGETTGITIEINDRAMMSVGSENGVFNSVFQVGNTYALRSKAGSNSVSFTLALSGADSLFRIGSRGFVGLGVGIVNNFYTLPSNWTMDMLTDVKKIEIDVTEGTFQHDRIFSITDPYASLLVMSSDITAGTGQGFYFDYTSPVTDDTTQATILGGGNLALIGTSTLLPGPITANNVVTNGHAVEENGVINPRLTFGLFSSKTLIDEKTALVYPVSGTAMFNYWVTSDLQPDSTIYVNASQDEHNLLSVAYADYGQIVRGLLTNILARGGVPVTTTNFKHTLEIGAVSVDLGLGTTTRDVAAAFELA
jgi:hypothetical protein